MFSRDNSKAFTLIELLVVVAIIALLVGIMVPAVQNAMDTAKDGVVRTQLYNIGIGLDLFKNDFGNYPSSSDSIRPGAQLLCDSLVGTDLLGYVDPNTGGRKKPYIKLETAEFEEYPDNSDDMDYIMKCKWGWPILYYAARVGATLTDDIRSVYNAADNDGFVTDYTDSSDHPLADAGNTYEWFYGYIRNPQIEANDVPYRADSFILVSAGKDGIYGNEDDIVNFDRKGPIEPLPGGGIP